MKVAGEYQFSHSRDEVWQALQDPDALRASLPGARRLDPTGPDAYAIVVDVGVGSVKGTYDGSFALEDKVAPESCTVRATASGRPGSVTALARMRLADDADEDAVLSYEAEATVTGPLAGVGQRLMGAAARRTTEQFLSALDGYIEQPSGVEPEPGEALAEPVLHVEPSARVIVGSALAGAAVALLGVVVGRWTARR